MFFGFYQTYYPKKLTSGLNARIESKAKITIDEINELRTFLTKYMSEKDTMQYLQTILKTFLKPDIDS